jgi:hypothetical protein
VQGLAAGVPLNLDSRSVSLCGPVVTVAGTGTAGQAVPPGHGGLEFGEAGVDEGGCGPERCDKGSRCATPVIPAGHAMTQVMIARLSQPSIAGLLPAPSPGNRVTAIRHGRSVGR